MDNMYVMLMEGGQPFTIAMLAPDTKPQSITCVLGKEESSQKDTGSETRLSGAQKLH
jgi:hypothetical protein